MAIAVVRADIENVYGVNNVRMWSQLDADSVEADTSRITTAINLQTETVQNRFRNSPYDINFGGTQFTVTNWIAILAGVWLYFNRGSRDVSDQENSLSDKMLADELQVMQDIDTYLMGSRDLPTDKDTAGPSAPVVIP